MSGLLSSLVIPVIICAAGLIMIFGKKQYFDSFIAGAGAGMRTAVGLLPTLTALVVAVSMLNASGGVALLCRIIAPAAGVLGLPPELLPLLLTRPVSGSASTAVFSELLEQYGADSFPALCASVIMGSSDTMIYIITVYFSSVGVKKTRYTFPCALAVTVFVTFFGCFVCRLFFGG